LGIEVNKSDVEDYEIYVVLKTSGCFQRVKKQYGNPEIQYSSSNCNPKQTLKVEDFNEEYILIKKL
jgi:hypothetical protein